jgi:HD-GYP domain-containing protein (c-di-GMP phosphodiesterase class II)
VYDSMTSNRPYHPARNKEAAIQHIEAGKQFDPRVVKQYPGMMEQE